MLVLEWRQTARDDLLAIIDYISDDNPGAAQRLKDDIEAKGFQAAGSSEALPAWPYRWYAG